MTDTLSENPQTRQADAACAARYATAPLARAIALALSLATGHAHAATFTVTNAGDAGAGTLRDAVVTANQTPGPDIIEFAPGLGEISLLSEIVITETLDIIGPAGQQVIRGSGFSRLLAVRTTGAVITLQNLYLANGGSSAPGGGDCQAYIIGRGTFASYGDGGAVCSIDDITLVGTTITGSGLSGDSVNGGGLFSSGNITLIDSTISSNSTNGTSSRGGGVFAGGGLVMTNSVISGNSTAGDYASGGGLWFNGDAQIGNSVISGNTTAGTYADGGGLGGFGSLLLEESSVIGNSTSGAAAEGGGIRLSTTSLIVNSTISGNSTAAIDAPGGGIFLSGTNIAIANSTITSNTSQAGAGGVESRAVENLAYSVLLDSTILAGNSGPDGNFRAQQGSGAIIVDLTDSLFGDAAAEVTGTNARNTFTNDPGLGPIGDNGCGAAAGAPPDGFCVPTHLPVAGSAAIDAGANSSGLAFDQRGSGFLRTLGDATDVGALEAELPPPPPVPADLRVAKTDGNVVTAPGEVLTWRIDFANVGELGDEGVALIETVPEATTFNPSLSGDWVCNNAGAAGSLCRFEIGTLSAGAGGTVDFSVTLDVEPDRGEIVNEVVIVGADSDISDPNPLDNVAFEITPLSNAGQLVAPARGATESGFLTGFADPETRAAVPRLGAEAAAIGDFDGDGLADVAVGAPGADSLLLVQGRPFATDALALPLSEFTSPDFPGFLVRATDGFAGLGDRIAGIGDANGDGLDGLVFTDGAINFNPLTGPRRGAYLQPGFDVPPGFVIDQGGRFAPQDVAELVSEQATGPFATSLAGLGDVNADGLDDFALAFSFGTRPFQQDTVFVLFGDPELAAFQPGSIVVEDASAANGLRVTNSGSDQSRFGSSISRMGDFNGDGVEDFAIGAPAQGNGAVFIVFGSPSLADSSEGFIDTESLDGGNGFAILGGENSRAFGTRIAAAGDFDGDGHDDLLVAERRPAGEPGTAHIVFGTDAELPRVASLGATTDALRSTRVSGAADGDEFGISGAGLGDLDGDGLDDIALGAPGLTESFDGQFEEAPTGRVFVLFGSDAPEAEIRVTELDSGRGYWLLAPTPGIRFGAVVAGPGDFDGDGVPDLLVTAPATPFEGVADAGQFWIVSGALRPNSQGLVLDIQAFSVIPDTVFAGDIAEISWAAVPDDELTVCAGSGLPGTAWQATGLPASGTTELDTSALGPGAYLPTLTCERDGETAEVQALLEVLEPPVEIQAFDVAPDSLFVGNIAEISWTATPEDVATVCAGSGLPGTSWNTADLPASGALEVETSALEPGTYFPALTCERNGETAQAESVLEVLEPPAALSLAGNLTVLQFFGDRFVQVEVSNDSGVSADSIVLDLSVPDDYQAIAVFRLAGSCNADDAGDFACDAGSIPDWQCGPAPGGFACELEALPAEATAAVVVQLSGDGPGQIEAAADAANARPVSIDIPVGD